MWIISRTVGLRSIKWTIRRIVSWITWWVILRTPGWYILLIGLWVIFLVTLWFILSISWWIISLISYGIVVWRSISRVTLCIDRCICPCRARLSNLCTTWIIAMSLTVFAYVPPRSHRSCPITSCPSSACFPCLFIHLFQHLSEWIVRL